MGWGSGSEMMSDIIYDMKKKVKDKETRKIIYKILIESFENNDWDTQEECMGSDKAFDEVLKDLHATWE
jgi:hypothetical protein